MSSLRSLKVSDVFSMKLSTLGNFFAIVEIVVFVQLVEELFFGVMDVVLFFSSVISVIGLQKLSILGLLESGAILGSLILNGEQLPSGDKKLVSLD